MYLCPWFYDTYGRKADNPHGAKITRSWIGAVSKSQHREGKANQRGWGGGEKEGKKRKEKSNGTQQTKPKAATNAQREATTKTRRFRVPTVNKIFAFIQ